MTATFTPQEKLRLSTQIQRLLGLTQEEMEALLTEGSNGPSRDDRLNTLMDISVGVTIFSEQQDTAKVMNEMRPCGTSFLQRLRQGTPEGMLSVFNEIEHISGGSISNRTSGWPFVGAPNQGR